MGSLGFSRYQPLGGMNWAPVLGLRQKPGHFTGPAYKSSFNPASRTWGVGLRDYFLNPISCPPTLGYSKRGQRVVSFLGSDAISTWLLRAGLIKALSPSNVLW